MKSILTLVTFIAVLAVAVPTPSMAASKKKADAAATDDSKSGDKKDDKKKDTYPLYGEVVSVTDSLLTIKGAKANRLFTITKDTKIHNEAKGSKEDKAATIKDVKVGAWVGGLVKKAPEGSKDNPTLVSLNVGVKQKEDKKDAKAETKTETDKHQPAKPETETAKKKSKKKKDADAPATTTTN